MATRLKTGIAAQSCKGGCNKGIKDTNGAPNLQFFNVNVD
jgi:hypothetical protein